MGLKGAFKCRYATYEITTSDHTSDKSPAYHQQSLRDGVNRFLRIDGATVSSVSSIQQCDEHIPRRGATA